MESELERMGIQLNRKKHEEFQKLQKTRTQFKTALNSNQVINGPGFYNKQRTQMPIRQAS